MKIRTLIIDDEELARELIKKFLETEPEFEVIGEAGDGFDGLKQIQSLKPDLIFLDIQMPKLTGLEMLELMETPPQIIFTTAYDQYAIEAFEKNALDYLLKPFSKDRFTKALIKVKSQPQASPEIKDLQNDIPSQRVVIKNGAKIEMVEHSEIIYVEAYGDYIWIHTAKGKHLKQKTMKEMESSLGKDFLRVHRSYLVNLSQISKLELYDKYNYQVILKNNHKITVSRNGYKSLKETLGW